MSERFEQDGRIAVGAVDATAETAAPEKIFADPLVVQQQLERFRAQFDAVHHPLPVHGGRRILGA